MRKIFLSGLAVALGISESSLIGRSKSNPVKRQPPRFIQDQIICNAERKRVRRNTKRLLDSVKQVDRNPILSRGGKGNGKA